MNNSIIHPQIRSCFKCRYEAVTAQFSCPRCGKRLYTMSNIRWRGVLLVVIGLFLTAFMSAIAVFVTGLLIQGAQNPETSRKLNEQTALLVAVYFIFGGVIAIGLTAVLTGFWQIIFGRRNMILLWLFLTLIFLTFVVGSIFEVVLK